MDTATEDYLGACCDRFDCRSVVFFLISNSGIWVAGKLYPLTMSGLAACYVAALPFFRNSIMGDLAYAALMFGSYHLLRHGQARLTASTR